MNIPPIISALLKAQDAFDSTAYANCFSDDAVVHDEGKDYRGKQEIRRWNEMTNEKYNTVLEALHVEGKESKYILSANVSGTFDGSPLVLKYHFTILKGLIRSLRVTE